MKWHFDDFIYGSIDGAVTTFAIVAGVMGASLPSGIILILVLLICLQMDFLWLLQIIKHQKLETNLLK